MAEAVRRVLRPGSAAGQPRRERWSMLIWAAVLLLLALSGLGRAPLFDLDEGAFSEATREMLVSGDWGHTTLNGEPRWDKPILSYWLQALSVLAFGLDEAALRLPSALAGWGWAVALMAFAWPRWGRAAGLAAAAVLASSLGVLLISRAATADALLNLWLTLAMLDLWRHLESDGAPQGRPALRRAAVWIALGVLTKGPVALLVPAAGLLLWLATEPGQRWVERAASLLGDSAAWLLLLGIALPWYAYAWHRHGNDFVAGFLLKHNLQRFTGPLEGHGAGVGYYLVVLPLLMLPWTPLLIAVVRRLRPMWLGDPLARYLLCWAGFVLVFFSLSGTKLPHYLLYGYSPLALLAGRELLRWLHERADATPGRALQGLLALLLAWPWLMAAAAVAVQRHAAALDDPYYRALLAPDAQGVAPLWWSALAAGAVTAGATWAAWRRSAPVTDAGPGLLPGPLWRLTALGVGGVAIVLQQVLVLLPWWGERLQGGVRRAAEAAQAAWRIDPGGWVPTAVQWGLHQPSFAIYLRQEAPRRAPRAGELALVRRDRLDGLAAELLAAEQQAALAHGWRGGLLPPPPPQAPADLQAPTQASAWQVLHEERGLVLLRWRGLRLLAPPRADRARDPGPAAASARPVAPPIPRPMSLPAPRSTPPRTPPLAPPFELPELRVAAG